ESIDDPEIVSIVLANASWAQSDAAALDEALATIRRASALDVPAPDRFHACLVELDTLVRLGRFAEAVELGEPAVQEASALGLERWIGAKLAANVAEAHLGLGTAARAMTLLDRCR